MRNSQVTHFGMYQAMDDLAADQSSAADPGADGQVDGISEAARRTPAGLP